MNLKFEKGFFMHDLTKNSSMEESDMIDITQTYLTEISSWITPNICIF